VPAGPLRFKSGGAPEILAVEFDQVVEREQDRVGNLAPPVECIEDGHAIQGERTRSLAAAAAGSGSV